MLTLRASERDLTPASSILQWLKFKVVKHVLTLRNSQKRFSLRWLGHVTARYLTRKVCPKVWSNLDGRLPPWHLHSNIQSSANSKISFLHSHIGRTRKLCYAFHQRNCHLFRCCGQNTTKRWRKGGKTKGACMSCVVAWHFLSVIWIYYLDHADCVCCFLQLLREHQHSLLLDAQDLL